MCTDALTLQMVCVPNSYIENDYLYFPGLKYINVFIHMSRAYPIDLYLF